MLKTDRLQAIMLLLGPKGRVQSSEVMEKLAVSDMTVRRDLAELEKQGLVERFHGGAKLQNFYLQEELSHIDKKIIHHEQKERIARRASELINDGDTIFLGPGTTIELLAQCIQADFLRIVTNCRPVFDQLNKHKKNWKLYLLGGELREKTQCLVGEIADQSLESMYFQKAFVSCNAVNGQKIMTSTFEEGQTQQIALNKSDARYLLIDHSKIGKRDFSVYYSLRDVTTVITDEHEQKYYEKLENVETSIV
ncbi:DeoR/GlpR family DNA-binding transcription regulator [Enterococcus sp. AZ196]|uniref:DeoR/GlpR family DNA-binding transcription regulator n=1 Tax=Enterococcus sp. AZ196 TaxID=2774659 RepID=UPI003D29DAED